MRHILPQHLRPLLQEVYERPMFAAVLVSLFPAWLAWTFVHPVAGVIAFVLTLAVCAMFAEELFT